MRLNGISKIKDDEGDFVVLTDYGLEGIAVSYQCDSAEEAAEWIFSSDYTGNHAVVQVVRADISSVNVEVSQDCSAERERN